MAEKYLYFRGDATLANDDDAADGSNVYPLSSFRGMESVSDTTITMYRLCDVFASSKDNFIVVADDVDSEYIVDGITEVSDFTVQADHA